MGIWDKYKLNDLPEDQRGEVIKTVAHELEETNRTKLNSGKHQTVRGLAVAAALLATIPLGLIGYNWVDSWREIKVKSLTPVVCPAPPPPPPCPAGTVPAFDIKVVPVTTPPTPAPAK